MHTCEDPHYIYPGLNAPVLSTINGMQPQPKSITGNTNGPSHGIIDEKNIKELRYKSDITRIPGVSPIHCFQDGGSVIGGCINSCQPSGLLVLEKDLPG